MWHECEMDHDFEDERYFTCHATDRSCCGTSWVCKHGYRNYGCQCGCSTDLCERCEEEREAEEREEES